VDAGFARGAGRGIIRQREEIATFTPARTTTMASAATRLPIRMIRQFLNQNGLLAAKVTGGDIFSHPGATGSPIFQSEVEGP